MGSCIPDSPDREALWAFLQLSPEVEIHTPAVFGYSTHRSFPEKADSSAVLRCRLDGNRDYRVSRCRIEDVVDQLLPQ